MGKVPVRKRLKSVKKGRKKPNDKEGCSTSAEQSTQSVSECGSAVVSDNSELKSVSSPHGSSTADIELDSGSDPKLEAQSTSEATTHLKEPVAPNPSLLEELKKKMDAFLWTNWLSVLESDGLSVLLLSRDRPRTSQRTIFFHYSGSVDVIVHCQKVDCNPFIKDVPSPVYFSKDTINEFVDRAASIVSKVRLMEICAGADSDRYNMVWEHCPGGYIDKNPYRETRYVETFRSVKCSMLVLPRTWRCVECSKMLQPLRRRLASAVQGAPHENTPNICLTEEQMLKKLKDQRRELDCAKKKIKDLHRKVEGLIKKEGVPVDNDLYSDMMDIFENHKISPGQEVFLHQQVKASQVNKKSGMRWHPTMIRLALSLHLTSPAAYQLLRDTGMVKLPSSRTLFDYSHVKPMKEGIDNHVIESVAKRLEQLKPHQKYHALLADEMYISKNLVFQKSSGRIIGYTKLDEADREVRALNEYLDDPDNFEGAPKEQIASRVMCYMIKGTSNSIKEVVASFAVNNVSPNQMYLWTWHVIGALERNGIKIAAFVCDGSSINRAFINLHAPVTIVKSGIVFDTVNKAAPDRVLYFISDVAHLLKTTRNCFYKSRINRSMGKRCMRRRGKKIVWDFIIKLYKEEKHRSLRKSFKLNPVNVYPDAYSCMKVSYAAQVLSRTVALDLEKKNYNGVSETVHFIKEFNDWFDRLNGAHSSVGTKKRNANLAPYVSQDDPRFKQLENFLDYLDDWKLEAYSMLNVTVDCTVNESVCPEGNEGDISGPDLSFNPVEDKDDDDGDTKASQRILSHQTLLGIETTTRAFIQCVRFLLSEGTPFINARIFSQDPLEQHFSKQRAGGGGSTNPNLWKFLSKNRGIHIQGQLGIKKPKGNSGETVDSHVEVTEEPLPKRKCVRPKKFSL